MRKGYLYLLTYLLCCLTPSYAQETWVELITGASEKLNSISSTRNTATWVCGESSTVLKSTNSGETWIDAGYELPPETEILNIFSINEDFALCAGYKPSGPSIFRTSNGGLTWATVYTSPNGRINGIYMLDIQKGVAVGSPVNGFWVILKTTDSGLSWHPVTPPLPQSDSETGFANAFWAGADKIWFGTNNSRIYHSMNLGDSWSFLSTGQEQYTKNIWFDYNFNIGYSGSVNLIRTSNTGSSWNSISVPGSGEITGITGSGMARLNWLVRNDNKIYYSSNYGTDWNLSFTAQSGNYTNISIEKNGFFGGAVFALKDNGGITRTFFLVNGIEQISGEIPSTFYLLQNFPNPFNPVTKIRFGISKQTKAELKIYNSTGQEIETPLIGELYPSVYEITFDASRYSSGIYYYRLVTGNFSETRKMLVVK